MKRVNSRDRIRRAVLAHKRGDRNLERRRRRIRAKAGLSVVVSDRPARFATIAAPAELTLEVDDNDEHKRRSTLKFFKKILSTPSVEQRCGVIVDLRDCEQIGASAGVWLISTVQLAKRRFPEGYVSGIDPRSARAANLLNALKFHQHLDYLVPPPRNGAVDFSDPNVPMELESRSGGLGDDRSGEKMPAAGAAISEVMEATGANNADTNLLKEEIHVAINEALLNVRHHAYGNTDIESGKLWWAIGLVDKAENSFDLMVVDRGQGIPKTLDRTVSEFATEFIKEGRLSDGERIRAAIEYGRSQASKLGKPGRGKGLPQMVKLLDYFPDSMVVVESLKGTYIASNKHGSLEQVHYDNVHGVPGTMIVWHLNLNRDGDHDEQRRDN